MNKIETGGPAFPTDCNKNILYGMDLRDYFAAKAMQAVYPSDYDYKTTARMAYEVADAMLEARK